MSDLLFHKIENVDGLMVLSKEGYLLPKQEKSKVFISTRLLRPYVPPRKDSSYRLKVVPKGNGQGAVVLTKDAIDFGSITTSPSCSLCCNNKETRIRFTGANSAIYECLKHKIQWFHGSSTFSAVPNCPSCKTNLNCSMEAYIGNSLYDYSIYSCGSCQGEWISGDSKLFKKSCLLCKKGLHLAVKTDEISENKEQQPIGFCKNCGNEVCFGLGAFKPL